MFQVDVFIRDDRSVTFVYPFGAKHGSQFCSNHARAPTLMDTRNMDACAGNHPVRVASSTIGDRTENCKRGQGQNTVRNRTGKCTRNRSVLAILCERSRDLVKSRRETF